MERYNIIFSKSTQKKIEKYYKQILIKPQITGEYLKNQLEIFYKKDLENIDLADAKMSIDIFLEKLINTKLPQIFAESSVAGDGTDWTFQELSILGDIGISVKVDVFDDGTHYIPKIHSKPFKGNLLFIPGALLKNGYGNKPADWIELVTKKSIQKQAYFKLYERRLLPMLLFANQQSKNNKSKAVITIPGLGCGQFAGPFVGQLGSLLNEALKFILNKHKSKLSEIILVYYDPYAECQNETVNFGHISYLVRPLLFGNKDKPQLCNPEKYFEKFLNNVKLELFSFVAWDHVSWPGNDFYIDSRATDDGVKAAATDSMYAMTGIKGKYNKKNFKYEPSKNYDDWEDVVLKNNLKISIKNKFIF
jgi:hypothetical protein